jgi:hypothetical protein
MVMVKPVTAPAGTPHSHEQHGTKPGRRKEMMSAFKPFPVLATLPLAFVGCTSTNPKAAFDDVGRHVTARTGQEVRWMRDDTERDEIEKAVAALLQTNLTAQSCVGLALLNNRTLQAEFESIGISQAELAQATRLKNPEFSGSWRWPNHAPHRAQRRVCTRAGLPRPAHAADAEEDCGAEP